MKIPPFILWLIGTMMAAGLLFEQSWGINMLLFTAGLILLWYVNRPTWLSALNARLIALASLSASAGVALGFTYYAHAAYIICVIAMAGTLCFSSSSIPMAIGQGIWTIISGHLAIISDRRRWISDSKASRVLKVSVFPAIIAGVFFLLYYAGSPAFALLIDNIFPDEGRNKFFWGCVWWGFILFGTFFINEFWPGMLWEHKQKNSLTRETHKPGKISGLSTGIRKEKDHALITLWILNILILMVNLTDLYFAAMDELPGGISYSEYVHQGINTLILSLVLAISLILYHFRGGLNFFNEAGIVRSLSYLWICQNILLALMAAYKNLLYVQEYGLTHKRIGVWVYIVLVIAGLITTYMKVRERHSLWRLVKINFSIAMLVLLSLSFVNWDAAIARHNLYEARRTDFNYLFSLSDNSLPVMQNFADKSWWSELQKEKLAHNIEGALRKRRGKDWRGMTWADYQILRELNINK
ncbi:DUF4173 domain-containing protein [Roseivirga sp. BDSF3-8]|uniref:DUF4153 domain-containing protein n=1 Tax=Roseivirga sp. BDSF3-8 TaxID=3241598 RepID=UPI0035321B1E